MTMLTDSDAITRYRLKVLQVAIALEVSGMTRRGMSATEAARREFGITKRRKIDVYFEYCRITNQDPSQRMCDRRAESSAKRKQTAP